MASPVRAQSTPPTALAETATLADGAPPPIQGIQFLGEDRRTWGLEVDVVRPLLAGQFQLKGTYTAWRAGSFAGEIVFGGNALFGRDNDDGKQTELQAIVGYRQFVWRGLHAELTVLPGYAHHRSTLDRMTRNALVASAEAVAGYRWDLTLSSVSVYLLTDAGAGLIFANSDRWPTTSVSKFRYQTPYFAGNIALGVRF